MAPIREMLADSGVTEQQWRVLRVLSESGPSEASRVADRASLRLPSLTRIAQSMKDRGLLSQVQDKTDRRRQVMDITPAGQAIIDQNLPMAQRISARYKAKLGEDRYNSLIELLYELSNPA